MSFYNELLKHFATARVSKHRNRPSRSASAPPGTKLAKRFEKGVHNPPPRGY